METNKIHNTNCLEGLQQLKDASIHCCVTSPPYFNLRNYGHKDQIGLEKTPEDYIAKLVDVFREVKRVLRDDGTLWIVIGDSYTGNKNKNDYNKRKTKDLTGIPWMLAFALRADGWYLRQDIIWHKPNSMPESVSDRFTKSHEYIFLLSKSQRYYFDQESVMEEAVYDGRKDTRMKGSHKYSQNVTGLNSQIFAAREHERWVIINGKYMRNKRDVWTVNTKPFKDAHFAVFPEALIVDCIKAGCPKGGIVLDPFMGSGTTAVVAGKFNRKYIGFELNPEYVKITENRIEQEIGLLFN